MNTTYLESTTPIVLTTQVLSDTRNYFDSFTKNTGYIQMRKVLLNTFPQLKDFNINNHTGENFFELEIFNDPIILTSLSQIPNCNLHLRKVNSFNDNVMLFTYFGFCINMKLEEVTTQLFRHLHGKGQLNDLLQSYTSDKLSAIFIPLQTSKQELITWINENWSKIEKQNKSLPKFTSTYIPKNIVVGQEISDLRAKELTYNQISDILFEKYPEDGRLADYNQIKLIHHRFVEYIANGYVSSLALKSLHSNT